MFARSSGRDVAAGKYAPQRSGLVPLIAFAATLIACGTSIGGLRFGGGDDDAKKEAAVEEEVPPVPEARHFVGVYRAKFGEITLVDDAGTLRGSFVPNNGHIDACQPSPRGTHWICKWRGDRGYGSLRLGLGDDGFPVGTWGTSEWPTSGGSLELRLPTAEDGPPVDTTPVLSRPTVVFEGYGGACASDGDCPGSVKCLCPKGKTCSSGRRCATSPGWYCTFNAECGGGTCRDGKCSNGPEGKCLIHSECPGGRCSSGSCAF